MLRCLTTSLFSLASSVVSPPQHSVFQSNYMSDETGAAAAAAAAESPQQQQQQQSPQKDEAKNAHLTDLLDMLENPTAEQLAKIEQLRLVVAPLVAKEGELSSGQVEDWNTYRSVFLCRHLIARKWDVAAALDMIKTAAKWRKETGIDSEAVFPNPCIYVRGYGGEAGMRDLVRIRACGERVEGANPALEDAVLQLRQVASEAFHSTDRKGRPVFISRPGICRVDEMLARSRSVTPPGEDPGQMMLMQHIRCNEVGATIVSYCNEKVVPKIEKSGGSPHTAITAIFDCEGLSMGHLKLLELMKLQSELDKQVAAEGLYACFVVNAGAAVRAAWAIMSLWIDERTKSKVHFLAPGEPTKAALLEHIAPENLPTFLGGTCKCADGCVPEPGMVYVDGVAKPNPTPPPMGPTRVVHVHSGKSETIDTPVARGDAVAISIYQDPKFDISFGVKFVAASGESVTVREAAKMSGAAKLDYTAQMAGKVVITLDNSYSWVRGKDVQVRVLHTPAPAAAAAAAE
jgi:hypothetical protein